jgi:alpha-L-rhamnosidase
MKPCNLIPAVVAVAVCFGWSATLPVEARPLGGGLTPQNLRCEYLVDPLGIGAAAPRLSWTLESGQRGQVQTAYRILVASNPKLLSKDTGDLWDSGKVASDESAQISYGGKPLATQMCCYWKVRVWDRDDRASSWSKPAGWTMGLLQPEDWKAKWIAFDASRQRDQAGRKLDFTGARWIWHAGGDAKAGVPVGTRYFRKDFEVPEDRELISAACAVTADNSYRLFLNGRRIRSGNNFKEAMAGDVKEHLHKGKNVLGIEAANEGTAPNPAGVLGILRLQFAAGEPLVIVTDGSWRSAESAPPAWMNLDFDAGGWQAVQVAGDYGVAPWGRIDMTAGNLFLPPAQYLRTRFAVDKPVKRATLYASALGNYELYLNGRQVGNAYFTPGWTDYKTRVYYNTFDVTKQLKKGFNVLGGILADGWYSGYVGFGRMRDHYGQNPRFAAQLQLEYADGTSRLVTTDETWKATTGPILEGDFLMGETYDARQELPDWNKTYFDGDRWQPVDVAESIAARIESYPGVLVHACREIKPVKISDCGFRIADSAQDANPQSAITNPQSSYVYDMGTNFAGFVRLKVHRAQPGQKIVLRFAERLNPDGTIYVTNLRSARATDTYICKGSANEVWQPRFTFHGFQYVEVTGYPGKPGADAITGVELTSATPVVGRFECSDAQANTLYRNICQTQRANFIDIPTDCPQRDERLGWMGDAQIYIRTATYNCDVAAFFTKWMVDVEDAQIENGAFTDVSPRKVAMGGGTAAWGDAGVICPWTIYQVYGDTRILAEHYDAMQKWIDYCKGTCVSRASSPRSEGGTPSTQDLLRPAEGYGDWLSINADTPKDVLATAYFARSTKLVAQTAAVLGKKEDAEKYEQLFQDIRKAFNDAYVAPDGRIKGDTQTVYVLALAFDLLPLEKRETAVRHLVDNIELRDWHLSTGFVGTKDLMGTLTRFGRTRVAYRLFHNDTFPSWGFSIKHGATSIWERWDGWTPEKGFQDPGMNSFAHYSFGAVAEWMFKTIGGIDTDGPAYRHIIIYPRPGGRLTWAKTSYNSLQGEIATAWQVKDRTIKLDVTIPANTTATVHIPAKDRDSVTEGGKPAAKAKAVRFVGMRDGNAVFEVGSGVYHFTGQRL